MKTKPPDADTAAFTEETLQIEKNLAQQALQSGDRNTAWQHLSHVAHRLAGHRLSPKTDGLFVAASLELANVSFVLGKGFGELIEILQKALKATGRTGDRRSMAMINLHLGRLLYFAEQRETAMSLFMSGKAEVDALGDEDILNQAAEFIGLFYFIQGRFPEAIQYFEQAAHSFESETGTRVINPSGPLWLSYCAAFLGQFHRAIGTLDYYRRLAVEGADKELATTLRAVLGIILLGIKKQKEAYFHLSGALQEARKSHNALASYFAKGGLAFHHYHEGRLQEARDWIHQTAEEGQSSGLVHQYASPIVIETLFALHRQRALDMPHFDFYREFARIMREPNVHLRGVALRLRAVDAMGDDFAVDAVKKDLERSETYLKQSGDPIQLGKTRLEMTRVKLQTGEKDTARELAEQARKDFGSYVEVFFPDDLRPLLTLKSDLNFYKSPDDELISMFADVIDDLAPSADFDTLLSRTVRATNRFFGAERGGVFWFSRPASQKPPMLRGACNLSAADVSTDAFRENLAMVFKAFHDNTAQVMRRDDFTADPSRVKAMLAVPFCVEGKVRGVFYHDNAYVRDCFDNFDKAQLSQMAQWLTRYIDHIFDFSSRLKKKATDQLRQFESPHDAAVIAESPEMIETLAQADRIAQSDSAVLILGETGAGKEVLARRIHHASPRRNNPLVVVDPTAIPENLVESELFGYEKGAFTGADRQKKGRLELAHQGTLFIDEIGEIPRATQVKLLRALQEKTTSRIGGNKPIVSDFRIVTATNRDLAAEVAAGRFREDLYYRLNVIPITLPALRQRKADVREMARHFLHRFAHKYNHPHLTLCPEHEAVLTAYDWPGNVRELQNVMERAVLLSGENHLELHLPGDRPEQTAHPFADMPSLAEMERRYIQYVLDNTGGKLSGPGSAAEVLQIKRTTLYNRMKKLGLR
ncbi:MAG: sigma 54-interacting transcriptional regulator [Thermodesulfobacteriota bacterium]